MRFIFNVVALILVWLFTPAIQGATQEGTNETLAIPPQKEIPFTLFAQLPRIEKISLSPNGRFLAVVFPENGEAKFYIFDLAKENPEAPFRVETGDVDILRIEWLNNDRILIRYGYYVDVKRIEEDLYDTRLMAFDRDGGNAIRLAEWEEGYYDVWLHIQKKTAPFLVKTDNILSLLPDDPDHILIQAKVLNFEDLGVYKINVYTNEMTPIQEPMEPVTNWFADEKGEVRFGSGWEDGKRVFMIRPNQGAPWKRFDDTEIFKERKFTPLGFELNQEEIFVKTSINTGREAIYKLNLSTGTVTEKFFDHPEYDVDGVIFSENDRRLVAANYTADFPEFEFFDPEFGKMVAQIRKGLGGSRIAILDSTPDGRFSIIRSYNSNDPGTLYYFDKEEMELSPIWEVMPGLDPGLLSEVKKVEYLARDGLELFGYLTLPRDSNGENLPTVLYIHGGPWARDNMVFDPVVQFLASRGYAVLQPNFRGSSGFGDHFESLGYGQWGKDMQDDIMDGLNFLIRKGIANPDRVCIGGGSYGGYAALLGVGRDPEAFKCAFAFAPVTDIRLLVESEERFTRSSLVKKRIVPDMKRKEWGEISPVKHSKAIKVPILLIHGDDDSTVPLKHSQKMAKNLEKQGKNFKFIILKGAGHGIVEEKHRLTFFRALEDFMANSLGTGP